MRKMNVSKLSFFFNEGDWIRGLDEENKFLSITGDGDATIENPFNLILFDSDIFVVDVHLHQRDDWDAQGSCYQAFQVSL
jgi:hypothetical protein